MINIFIYGLDQFVVGDLSAQISEILARTFEAKEEDINFIAPNDMVFHNGVEQTSWRVIVEVRLPQEYEVVEHEAKEVLIHYISGYAIHVEVTFVYYARGHHYLKTNEDYPLYLTEIDQGESQNVDYDDGKEPPSEGDGDDEIYTEDIFKNVF